MKHIRSTPRPLALSALTVALAGPVASLTSCVGGSEEPPPADTSALQAFILTAAPPKMEQQLNIDYDGKLMLLGYDIKPTGKIKKGQRVKLTMYWKCTKKLDEPDWRLFTHILDGAGARVLNIDNVGPLRRMHGKTQILSPSKWEAGKVYVDEQDFVLPNNLKTDSAQVTVGVWRGNDRLRIAGGPKDGENRGIVANLQVEGGKRASTIPSTRVPELRVDRLDAKTKLTIDGKLDEEAWKTAPSTGAFVDVGTGRPNPKGPIGGSAKLLWDPEALYVAFEVRDSDVTGGFDKGAKDPHLWTKDTVELMIDPDGDGDNKDYYEIQINPQNLVFDSHFDSYNQPRKEPDGPFGHQDWSAQLQSAVVVDGSIDDPKSEDRGYVVEAKIPWKAFHKAKQAPPEVGQRWRMNLYAMQNNGGVGWSPILGQGNFHRASRFGKVLWAEQGWQPPATPAAADEQTPGKPGVTHPAEAKALPAPSASAAPQAAQAAPAASAQ